MASYANPTLPAVSASDFKITEHKINVSYEDKCYPEAADAPLLNGPLLQDCLSNLKLHIIMISVTMHNRDLSLSSLRDTVSSGSPLHLHKRSRDKPIIKLLLSDLQRTNQISHILKARDLAKWTRSRQSFFSEHIRIGEYSHTVSDFLLHVGRF